MSGPSADVACALYVRVALRAKRGGNVVMLLSHNSAPVCLLCFALTHTAFAQSPAALEYADPNADGASPRALHYRVGPDEPESELAAKAPREAVTSVSAAEAGLLSPYTLSAQVISGRSWLRATGGYDTAAQTYRARSSAEAAVTSYLALRVDFEHGPSTTTTDRVSLGARLQFLNQKAHGLDLGVGAFYQPNDFRGEGNVVGGLMLGRRFDRVALFGSALLGSDPEGDDQELDGRLGTLVRIDRLVQLGWDNRFRSVITKDTKRIGTTTVDWELALLPNAIITLGPVAIFGEAGFSALQQTEFVGQPEQRRNLRTGLLAMAGAGAAF